jgi:hypothetical protein
MRTVPLGEKTSVPPNNDSGNSLISFDLNKGGNCRIIAKNGTQILHKMFEM